MNASATAELPPPLYDTLLRLTPVNVLLFDTELVCRYAAPVGETFLGRRPQDLLGLPAADVLPPASNGLRPVLEQAAREARGWSDQAYRFKHAVGGAEQPCCWSIQVDPVAVDGYRGVLVSWQDIIGQAEERERLEDELQRLRSELARLRRETRERNDALVHLLSDLRNAVTPLSGYLQVIVRRPETLGGRTPAEVIRTHILPRVADILEATERLRRPPIYAPEENGAAHTPGAAEPAPTRT